MDSKVNLRCLESRDLATVLRWRNDQRIRQHMFNANLITESDHASWFKKSSLDPTLYLFMVTRDKIPFGFAQFHVSRCGTVADWGFYVDPDGPKGQGMALGKVVLSFGFDEFKLHRITGQVLNNNTRSIKLHKRMGFSDEGKLRSHHSTDLGYQDVHLFSLLAYVWKNYAVDIAMTNRKSDQFGD